MLPEPLLLIHSTSVAFHDIGHRIQLDEGLVLLTKCIDVPQNRCRPHPDLHNNGDEILQIAEEQHDGTGGIGQSENKDIFAERVVKQLQGIHRRRISVKGSDQDKDHGEPDVHEHGRRHLDDRQNADLKDHLFDQIVVLHQGGHSAHHCVRKEKPRNQSCCQEQDIRNLTARIGHLRSGAENAVKDHPVHGHRHNRRNHRPDGSQIGAGIAFFEIISGKSPDEPPVLIQLYGECQDPVLKQGKQKNTGAQQKAAGDFL